MHTTMITKSDLVYESPDGGKTIYSRKPGETTRTLVHEDPEIVYKRRWMMWRDILNAGREYPPLEDAIQQAEMIYKLVKPECKDNF